MSEQQFTGPLARLFGTGTGDGAAEVRGILLPPSAALPVPPATDRAVWTSVDSVTAHDLVARAERDLGIPWPLPLASQAVRVHRDGDRDAWETLAFERQRRLSRAAAAAALTLEEQWIDEVADGVILLCEQSSWCWPAHDDTRARHGAVLATVDDPFLDLGAGEVAGQLAWLDRLLGTQLDERYPGVRARIRREARLRIIDPFLARPDWHWLGLDGDVHNWNPWIHGNVLVTALQLLDDPAEADLRAEIVALVVEGLDRYVASLPDDGAIDEGYSYWWNGACRALEALDLLSFATEGRWDAAAAVESLRQTVAFPHRMHLGGDWYLNLADGQARPTREQPWHALHRAARRIGDDGARRHAAAQRVPGAPLATEREGLGRLLRGLTDAVWREDAAATSPLPRDTWLPSTEVLIARERTGSAAGLTLAIKGGHNGEHHNHNDVGSFVVAVDGVPVLVDAGRPTYTAATFGPRRYDIWTMQSAWHNVPEVRGAAQSPGAGYAASVVRPSLGDERTALSLDIAGAYEAPGLRAWRRRAALDRGAGETRVVIEDAWDVEPWTGPAEPPTTLRLLVAGEVELSAGALRVLPLGGARPVSVRWTPEVPAALVTRSLSDPVLSEVWGDALTRVDLLVTEHRSLRVTVELDAATDKDSR
ncbi:heparinase II/III family protein [Microbacterium sp. 4R-513]|uniref:heparinase II/III domain-containing protein n=1 Tax=Microbacterium sp. 4R-513 TaxID=2567934 RepID=UPI001F49AD77|nr:heparinase II/III family protein [Microbacterium sp. 4R-513]